ncbi:cytochrome b [Pseudomonas kurunegalensis]|uniref:cytochrome b n=1 Tax=Pseudomonas kurunegalensis TaxID=485880 RepID=UPI0035566736
MKKDTGYTATAKWLHWSMAAIWIIAWLIGILATHWRDDLNPDHGLTFLHKALASTLLFLLLARVAWRLSHPAPALPDSMSSTMKRLANLGHLALYAVALVALPVSGWYWSSVAGKPIMVAGLFELGPLREADQSLYDLAKAIHTYTAWACGILIAGHIFVALKHHFVERDNVLKGMLPGRN